VTKGDSLDGWAVPSAKRKRHPSQEGNRGRGGWSLRYYGSFAADTGM